MASISASEDKTLTTQPTGTPTPSSPPDGDCHFFRLPPELRLNIYDEVLSAIDFAGEANKDPITIRPPLFDTCQLLRKEIAPLYGRSLIAKSVEVLAEGKDYLINIGHAKRVYSALPGKRSAGLQALDFMAYEVDDQTIPTSSKLHGPVSRELAMLEEKIGCVTYRASYKHRIVAAVADYIESFLQFV
ncbi:hypothetical protein PRZ48_012578 [Zasmidium cellare]|uniref:Uncharacterized protein n=1 Tax=Zasmidium cellare TaxID=395010 RepID=A0ABR0E5Q0_ZASCE|nr:hypothetical protein PRZ48_012578 [Zasmidium cellare]